MSDAELTRANLIDAIYDERTQWPAGFNHRTVGALQFEGSMPPPQRPGRLPSDTVCLIEYDPQEGVLLGAYLDGANLRLADLSGLDFHGASLNWANLSLADLGEADLGGVSLHAALLSGARLDLANLSDADLSGAELSGANLSGATLSGADLTDALYDDNTIWPEGFDPGAAGAVRR